MNAYTIFNLDGKLLFDGAFKTYKNCIEAALEDNISLKNANLKRQNLIGANLDGADISGCDLSFTTLTNANLSEAQLSGATFHHTDLYNTCLAESDLKSSDFRDANFGATQIFGCDLSEAQFSGLSCFSLCFFNAKTIAGASFWADNKTRVSMNNPPVVVHGLSYHPVIFMDEHIITADGVFDREQWTAFLRTQKSPEKTDGCHKV